METVTNGQGDKLNCHCDFFECECRKQCFCQLAGDPFGGPDPGEVCPKCPCGEIKMGNEADPDNPDGGAREQGPRVQVQLFFRWHRGEGGGGQEQYGLRLQNQRLLLRAQVQVPHADAKGKVVSGRVGVGLHIPFVEL